MTVSIVLHFILITTLVWYSIYWTKDMDKYKNRTPFVKTLVVNPNKIIKESYHEGDPLVQCHQKTLQNKLLSEQQYLKGLKKEPLSTHQIDQLKKNKPIEKKKIKKVENQIKKHQNKQVKTAMQKRSIDHRKTKNIFTEQSKKIKKVDDLLNDLIDIKNISKNSKNHLTNSDQANLRNISLKDIDTYKSIIKNEIKKNFYDYTSFLGKHCDLKMTLMMDGTLLSISAVGGDPALCQAAISAAKAAKFPRPPNLQVYKVFKNAILEFIPQ